MFSINKNLITKKTVPFILGIAWFLFLGYFPRSIIFAYLESKWYELRLYRTQLIPYTNSHLHFKLAMIYLFRLDKKTKAVEEIEKAIKSCKEEMKIYRLNLISIYGMSKQYDKAILELKKAKDSGEVDDFLFHYWMAGLYNKKGDFKSAVKEYEEVLKTDYKKVLSKELQKELLENYQKAKEKINNSSKEVLK